MLALLVSGTQTTFAAPSSSVFATTVQYVVQFYPRWFTYEQANFVPANELAGPKRMGPLYGIVVAPNDDTLYASSLIDVAPQPMILTIPDTQAHYSLLTLDAYGDTFTAIASPQPGTYALTAPGWSGSLPQGVTQVTVPFTFSVWIFRADKFAANGRDQTLEAELFRSELRAETLSNYLADPNGGSTKLYPLIAFSIRYKVLADYLATFHPIQFLKQMQAAIANPAAAVIRGPGFSGRVQQRLW